MKCPACANGKLIRCELEPALSSLACRECGGSWVASTPYFRWLELSAAGGGTPADSVRPDDETACAESLGDNINNNDANKARLCPECGRLMARHEVGRGVAFRVDHCGTCGGTWLDHGEWEALCRHGLHRTLHRVFSPAWQAGLTQRERRDARAQMLLRKLGPDELAEVRRFVAWIKGRPKRSELLAVLLEEVRGD
jgi:Zn-finger nucleic acid-binding protein